MQTETQIDNRYLKRNIDMLKDRYLERNIDRLKDIYVDRNIDRMLFTSTSKLYC